MALQVIGPGFGRTGTASLKRALEILGFGPCHHMEEVLPDPAQAEHWIALVEGWPVDWDAAFAGFRSQVDWPGAHAWQALAAHYPEAKVVLSVRPEESWWRSYADTIGKVLMGPPPPDAPPYRRTLIAAVRRMIGEQTFGGAPDDKALGIAALRRRTEEVRAAIPADRLLVFDVSEGWDPLCRFLGVPRPEGPFPRVNSTEQFWAMLNGTPLPPR
jgi:hypothetical protein